MLHALRNAVGSDQPGPERAGVDQVPRSTLCIGVTVDVEQQVRLDVGHAAKAKNADFNLRVQCVAVAVLGVGGWARPASADQHDRLGAQVPPGVGFRVDRIGPTGREHAVDPTLEQGGERPPVDRKDEHERVRGVDARRFPSGLGGPRSAPEVRVVLGGEARVEAFGVQVGDLRRVTGLDDAFDERVEHRSGEALTLRMAEDC